MTDRITVGIVAQQGSENLQAVKAALTTAAQNAGKTINLVEKALVLTDKPAETARIALGDEKIACCNAALDLQDEGVDAIVFADLNAPSWLDEVQTEVQVRLFDATRAGDVVSADLTRLPKPFRIGMIGGLGPAATVDLYDKIVKASPAATDQEHFKLVVDQNPQIPDRTLAILHDGVDPTLAMYVCARRLEAMDCDCVIVPCNTAHNFVPYIERNLSVPFVSLIKTTIEEIKSKLGDKARIGLLATTGTIESGIYAREAKAAGLEIFAPDEAHKADVMDAIYGKTGVKAGFTTGRCHDELVGAAEYLVKNHDCNCLILGCTELPLILHESDDFPCAGKSVIVTDPTSALARRVVSIAEAANKERGC